MNAEKLAPKAPSLYLAACGEELREATPEEVQASEAAPDGIIIVDGFRCFAVDFTKMNEEPKLSCDLCSSLIADDAELLIRTRGGALLTSCTECAPKFEAAGYGRKVSL